MSRDSTVRLAKSTWIVLLLYIFANRFVGLVIGRVVADLLVFVLAVIAIPISLYCLIQMRRVGARGIVAHAIAALLLSAVILAIWVPNFLHARERARAARENRASVIIRALEAARFS